MVHRGAWSGLLHPLVRTIPIGLIPKPHQPGKWRMIVDLSFPYNDGVNADISEELSSIASEWMTQLHAFVGTQMVKLDLQSAYRIIPIHPQDQHLLEIKWEDKVYVDRANSDTRTPSFVSGPWGPHQQEIIQVMDQVRDPCPVQGSSQHISHY